MLSAEDKKRIWSKGMVDFGAGRPARYARFGDGYELVYDGMAPLEDTNEAGHAYLSGYELAAVAKDPITQELLSVSLMLYSWVVRMEDELAAAPMIFAWEQIAEQFQAEAEDEPAPATRRGRPQHEVADLAALKVFDAEDGELAVVTSLPPWSSRPVPGTTNRYVFVSEEPVSTLRVAAPSGWWVPLREPV
jgi:hypothetical protein